MGCSWLLLLPELLQSCDATSVHKCCGMDCFFKGAGRRLQGGFTLKWASRGVKVASSGLHLEGGFKEAGSRQLYIRGWGMCKKPAPSQSIPKLYEHELRQRLRIASDI